MISSMGEGHGGEGVDQPWVEGKGHIPPGWSLERQMEQVKIFLVVPALLPFVMKRTERMRSTHFLKALWSLVGGAM